jgi:hypothetical protein
MVLPGTPACPEGLSKKSFGPTGGNRRSVQPYIEQFASRALAALNSCAYYKKKPLEANGGLGQTGISDQSSAFNGQSEAGNRRLLRHKAHDSFPVHQPSYRRTNQPHDNGHSPSRFLNMRTSHADRRHMKPGRVRERNGRTGDRAPTKPHRLIRTGHQFTIFTPGARGSSSLKGQDPFALSARLGGSRPARTELNRTRGEKSSMNTGPVCRIFRG